MKTKTLFVALILLSATIFLSSAKQKPDSRLKEYTGKYTFPQNDFTDEVVIELKNDTLWAVATMGTIQLEHTSEEQFVVSQYGATVTFLRQDSLQNVTGVIVNVPQANMELQGIKVSERTK